MISFRLQVDVEVNPKDLQELLYQAYVDEGYTDEIQAAELLKPSNVLRRGKLISAVSEETNMLLGIIILVDGGSPVAKICVPGECELHLLAVAENARKQGIGTGLVRCAVNLAQSQGYEKILLATQQSMHIAHSIYQKCEFKKAVGKTYESNNRKFFVFERYIQ